MQNPPGIVYGKQTDLPFPPPGYQQPAPVEDEIEDDPEKVIDARVDATGDTFFQLRWSSGDLTWQSSKDMFGLKTLVRDYYEEHPELPVPEEFHYDEVDDIVEETQANAQLAITHVGVREDDPQYYDSENESDLDAVEPSEAPGSEPEDEAYPSTQVTAYPKMKDLEKFNADTTGSHPLPSVTQEEFASTASFVFCEKLHQQTGTYALCHHTIAGLTDCLSRLNNTEILQQVNRQRTGHAVKGLIITLWLFVYLKAHSNVPVTPYVHVGQKCGALRRAAIDLAHDTEQGDPSKRLLELTLVYWERRIRNAYAPGKALGYVDWSLIAWWNEIPDLPMLFQDHHDELQEKLMHLWKAEGLTEMTEYCLRLDLKAGRSPLARDEKLRETVIASRRMLGSMDPLLLEACICGNVASLAENQGSIVQKELRSIAARDELTPGTYANFFTDDSGTALTPAQLRVVMMSMRRYLNTSASPPDLVWIWKIDRRHFPKKNWLQHHVLQGLRRYTDWKSPDPKHPDRHFKRDEKRRKVLFHFIREVETMIAVSEAAGRLHVPCARPLTEVGYAKRPSHRLNNHHAKHVQSNYIMNLFHVLMMDSFGRDFRLQQVILYSCWRSGQAWLSEIILTRMLQAYTDGGKGLSHYQAGLSNWSANRYVGDEVWYRILEEADVADRLDQSYNEEVEEQKQRIETLEKRNAMSRALYGPVPYFIQGENGKAVLELLDMIYEYLKFVQDRAEESERRSSWSGVKRKDRSE